MQESELQDYLHAHIPLSRAMQVQVIAASPESVLLRAPLEPNINHRETVFGGSASALAILSAWSLLHVRLRAQGTPCRLVIQRNTMEYDLPVAGEFQARTTPVDPAAWERFLRMLSRRGIARIAVASVLEFRGARAGRFSGEFVAMVQQPGDASGGWNAVAGEFIAHRSPVTGVATILEWAKSLPSGASLLDVGCGFGAPVATALVGAGFAVHGIDASPELVAEFRRRLPGTPVRCEAAETSSFFERKFDAAIAIGLVFLLDEERQRQLIQRIAAALRPGGRFLFTAPAQPATWQDIQTGRTSRSLGKEGYVALLREVGLDLVREFTDEGENHYYEAVRPAAGDQQSVGPA